MGIYLLNHKVDVICSTKWSRLPQRWRRGKVSSFCLSSCCKQTSTHGNGPQHLHFTTRTKLPWQYLAKFGLIIQEAQLGKNKEIAAGGGGGVFSKKNWCLVIRAFCCFCLKWGNRLQSLPLPLSTLGEMPALKPGSMRTCFLSEPAHLGASLSTAALGLAFAIILRGNPAPGDYSV